MSKNNILKRLSPIHIVALICAIVIFATVVVSAIFYIGNEVKDSKREFDYTKETLTDYITLGDYENLTVTPEYSKIRDVDVKSDILNLVAGEKDYSSAENASYNTATKITVGDVVNLYYRGYVLDENGEREYMGSMSNLGGSSYATMKAYNLPIGADSFIPGFALALEGKTVGDYPRIDVKRDVEVKNDMIAFVSYTRYPVTTNQYSGVETQGTVETATAALVDLTLSKDKIDATFGAGFYEMLVGNGVAVGETGRIAAAKANGENVISNTTKGLRAETAEGVDYKYTKIAVEYTMAANYYENYQPLVVEFPENYHTADIAGKTAYFQIIIESVKEYTFKVNESNVAVTLSDKATVNTILEKALEDNDDFNEYLEGLTEEEKSVGYYDLYTQYLFHKDAEDNAMKNENALYQAIVDAIVDSTTVKTNHPDLEDKYNASLITFRKSYAENGKDYATIEEYAEAVIGGDHYVYVYEKDGKWVVYADENGNPLVPAEDDTTEYVKVFDWKAAVKQLSVDYYTERMAIHQIIKDKNLNPEVAKGEESAYDKAYARIYAEYSEEYKRSYCKSNGIDIDDMTTQEEQKVDEAVRSYLQSNLGFEYLTDRAYYQLVFDYLTEKDAEGNYLRLTIAE